MKNKEIILILFLTLLAVFLRFYKLGEIPQGFTVDEASIGYDAYSVLTTGKDQWGHFLPTTFVSLGDNKNPIYIYLTTIPVAIFGVNEFAVRFVAALSAVLLVPVTYFLAKTLFPQKMGIAIMSAFLFAISPWSIFISRIAVEANLGTLLTAMGVVFLLKYVGARRDAAVFKFYLTLSLAFLFLATQSYHSPKIFIPVIILATIIIHRDTMTKTIRDKLITAGFLIILSLPLIIPLISQNNRLNQINLIQNIGVENMTNEQRGECLKTISPIICKLAYNKSFNSLMVLTRNYLSHFSITTLFTKGPALTGYAMENNGLLYLFELPFFVISVYFLIKIRGKPEAFVLLWLGMYPLASTLAGESHPARMLVFLPIAQIIVAYGIYNIYNRYKHFRKVSVIFPAVLVLFAFGSLTKYLITYFAVYPAFSSRVLQYGYKPLFVYLTSNEKNYRKIIISRRYDDAKQYIYLLFYNKINPAYFQASKEITVTIKDNGWIWVDRIGKYNFKETLPVKEGLDQGDLLIGSPDEFPKEVIPLIIINDLKGDTLFQAVNSDKLINYYAKKELSGL